MAEMTSRERWLVVLQRERPDRVPMDYWATPRAAGIFSLPATPSRPSVRPKMS